MKQNSKLTVRLAWLLASIVLATMSVQSTTYAKPTKKVSLTYTKIATMTVGTSKSLHVKSNGKVTFKTSNKSVVAVSKSKITAKSVGSAKITITAKKTGYKTTVKTFTVKVVPQKGKITDVAGRVVTDSAVNSSGDTVTISCSAIRVKAKMQKGITGYQFKYATNSKFNHAVKKNSKSNTLTFHVTARNTYYVAVRTYKKIGQTCYYSPWSTTVTHAVNKDYATCNHIWVDEQVLVKDEYYETIEIFECHCGKKFTNAKDCIKHTQDAENAYNEAVANGNRDEYWTGPYGNCAGGSHFYREIYHPAEYKTVTKCELCGATK